MKRVIAYVDGFNLYYGLRSKRWKWFYWLNISGMAQRLLKPDQILSQTKYFTSIVNHPPDRHKRQALFLEALQTLPAMQIYYGHFLGDTVVCRQCGHTYQTHHEKMTDVNIAVEMLADAYQDNFDIALLISADSDLVTPVLTVRRLFTAKRVIVAFPPKRFSNELKDAATGYMHIGPNILSNSVFPDEIVKPDGFVLRRPKEWR